MALTPTVPNRSYWARRPLTNTVCISAALPVQAHVPLMRRLLVRVHV